MGTRAAAWPPTARVASSSEDRRVWASAPHTTDIVAAKTVILITLHVVKPTDVFIKGMLSSIAVHVLTRLSSLLTPKIS